MDERINSLFSELFTRMREIEAQSKVQASRLDIICERIETQIKSVELQQSAIDKFLEHLTKQEERTEKRELNFWKVITVLIGAVLVLALGPKLAREFINPALANTGKPTISYGDIWMGIDNRRPDPFHLISDGEPMSG